MNFANMGVIRKKSNVKASFHSILVEKALGTKLLSINTQITKHRICPFCQATGIVKIGKVKGIQRYKCKVCLRNIRENHNTLFYGMKQQEKFEKFYEKFLFRKTLKQSAAEVGVSIQTAFKWRHHILAFFEESINKPNMFGECEIDIISIQHSSKGQKTLKLGARKRGGGLLVSRTNKKNNEKMNILIAINPINVFLKVIGCGNVKRSDIDIGLKNAFYIMPKIRSRSDIRFRTFARDHRVEHEIASQRKKYSRDDFGLLPFINDAVESLREWLIYFHGVSSKHLQHYLSWFVFLYRVDLIINRLSKSNLNETYRDSKTPAIG